MYFEIIFTNKLKQYTYYFMSKQTKKCLSPTKNPFMSMKALSVQKNNYPSLNLIIESLKTQSMKSLQNFCMQKRTLLKHKGEPEQLSHAQNIYIKERGDKNSNMVLITNKIQSILDNFSKGNRQDSKQKRNNMQKIKFCKENKQNEIKTLIYEKHQSRLVKQNRKSDISGLTLRDINIKNINYPFSSDKYDNVNKQSLTLNPTLSIPKPIKNKNNPSQTKNRHNHKSNFDVFPLEDTKGDNSQQQLTQIQNSQQYINTLLNNLEKDFLPKTTDFFVYNQQKIKLPKILRKNKANNQMYKSCTEVHSKIKDSSIQCFKSVVIEKSNTKKGSVSQSLSLIQRQLNNFLMGLKTQICFDSDFKKMKQWFLYSKMLDKWKKLEGQLRRNSLWVNQLTMKVMILYQNQEGTLCESLIEQEYSIKQLVITFRAAQQHWTEYILNKFDEKLLIGAGLTESVLDSSNKGYISIQDLIRFLHCKLKEFYYTRDLNMIYLRLKGGQKLHYQQLIAKISSNVL